MLETGRAPTPLPANQTSPLHAGRPFLDFTRFER